MRTKKTPTEADEIAKVCALLKSGSARAIREGHGVSRPQVARSVEVSPSTVWRWEMLVSSPKGQRATRYLGVLEGLMGR